MRYAWLFLLLSGRILHGVAQTSDAGFAAQIAAHRQHYKEEFLTEERSPLRAADTALLAFYVADPSWSLTARVELTPDARPFDMPTYSGKLRQYRQYAWLEFEVNGVSHRLQVYQNLTLMDKPEYRDYLFLPFKDLTNGETTYGGGRYLDFKTGDIADGKMTLDFNKCYNPWCAYSDGYNCPIPPLANHLQIEVPAGEKPFLGEKKKGGGK